MFVRKVWALVVGMKRGDARIRRPKRMSADFLWLEA